LFFPFILALFMQEVNPLTLNMNDILQDLKDSNPEIKRLAARALAQQGDSSQNLILDALESADRDTAAIMYETLFDAPGDFTKVFNKGTKEKDPYIRSQSIRYLFRNGSFNPTEGVNWLNDRDPYVRRRVISYLSWMNDRSSLGSIMHVAVKDEDPKVRKEALKLASVWGRKNDAGNIIDALKDKDAEVKVQAIFTLKKITGEDFGNPSGASDDELSWIVAKWQGWWKIIKDM
jgi:HEAT repeat protein